VSGPKPGTFFSVQEKDWDDAYALLLKSALRLLRGVVPGMRERKWGRIVGITSVSVKEPIPMLILSNVFRAGVTSLYKSLATEVAADNITVNTVLPGLTIGRWAMVGAGSVVTRSVPDYALVRGNPARPAGWVCRCGEKLSAASAARLICECGQSYRKIAEDRIEEVQPRNLIAR